ncbi:C4-dicarboxylate ABC transporter, partial [Photobacterium profundum]
MSVLLLVLMFFSLMYKRKFIPFIFILSGITVSVLNGNGLQQTALEFSSSFWDVILTIGLNIVTIVAFSECVNKNGSTKELVSLVYKPVGKIKDRYLILAVFYLIGLLLSVVITSASALSMIFMSTVFPILVSKGISKDGAAAMITSIGVIEFGPLKSSTIYMAEEQNKHIYDYVMN